MSTKRFMVGALVGGIVYFFLGYLVYGLLLVDYMTEHAGSATNVNRNMEEFVWWSLILGNLVYGALLAYVFNRANVISVGGGLVTGGILGFLVALSIDSVMYATTNIMTSNGMLIDVAAATVLSAVAGAIIAPSMGKVSR